MSNHSLREWFDGEIWGNVDGFILCCWKIDVHFTAFRFLLILFLISVYQNNWKKKQGGINAFPFGMKETNK